MQCSPVDHWLRLGSQSLVRNELREGVVLRVDGGMRTGRDVLVTAALGGDEYGFGTVSMIATGCIMARVCHTNNCPVGVASQREELRARFPGTPGDLVSPMQTRLFNPSCSSALIMLPSGLVQPAGC